MVGRAGRWAETRKFEVGSTATVASRSEASGGEVWLKQVAAVSNGAERTLDDG